MLRERDEDVEASDEDEMESDFGNMAGTEPPIKRKSHWVKFEEEVLLKGLAVEVPHPESKLIIPLKVFDILEDEILVRFWASHLIIFRVTTRTSISCPSFLRCSGSITKSYLIH